MNLTKWKQKHPEPFKDIFDFDHPFWGVPLFPSLKGVSQSSGWYPAIDVSEDKGVVTLKADIPGLEKKDIHLSVDGSLLTIRGERKSEDEEKKKDYHRVERTYGVFERSLDLGTHIDQDKIKAKYKDGVLTVTVPKSEQKETKKIEVEGE